MKLRPFLRLISSILLALALHPSSAAVVVNFLEQGGNVVASGNGTINTAALTDIGSVQGSIGFVFPGRQEGSSFAIGNTSLYHSWGTISGPVGFGGSSSYQVATSGSGDAFGLISKTSIYLPNGYVSGAKLAGNSTWTGKTFADLGITPGTYRWTWGSGATADSFTLNIGPVAPTPTPAAAPAIDVGKKGGSGERFTATSGSFLLTGTSVNVNQVQWNLLKGATHKVSVSGTKWSVKISPLKKGMNTVLVSGWNTTTQKGSKPTSVIITRK